MREESCGLEEEREPDAVIQQVGTGGNPQTGAPICLQGFLESRTETLQIHAYVLACLWQMKIDAVLFVFVTGGFQVERCERNFLEDRSPGEIDQVGADDRIVSDLALVPVAVNQSSHRTRIFGLLCRSRLRLRNLRVDRIWLVEGMLAVARAILRVRRFFLDDDHLRLNRLHRRRLFVGRIVHVVRIWVVGYCVHRSHKAMMPRWNPVSEIPKSERTPHSHAVCSARIGHAAGNTAQSAVRSGIGYRARDAAKLRSGRARSKAVLEDRALTEEGRS